MNDENVNERGEKTIESERIRRDEKPSQENTGLQKINVVTPQKINMALQKKTAAPQKRFVTAVKVFMTLEEKAELEKMVGNFSSLSNLIRHHLGFNPNATGRRKKNAVGIFNLAELEIEDAAFSQTSDFSEPVFSSPSEREFEWGNLEV